MKMMNTLYKNVLTVFIVILMALPARPFTDDCRGDVNQDNLVNITDVTTMIQYLLNDNAPESVLWLVDITGDGYFNISDVTALIDYLLTDDWKWPEPAPPLPENAQVFTVNGVPFAMIYVEEGTFMMGNNSYEDTRPVHQVTLSSYWIGETEVTADLWFAVMGEFTPYIRSRGLQPAAYLSWDNCQSFIQKLNELTGMSFRLPTEAQWEFAARGGNLSKGYQYSGSDDVNAVAWYQGTSHPSPWWPYVKTKAPNELGLYDMSGSLWEWCQDCYYQRYLSADPVTDPLNYYEPPGYLVVRGGSTDSGALDCRVDTRSYFYHGDTSGGLRLAL